jgi:hypothetical protein
MFRRLGFTRSIYEPKDPIYKDEEKNEEGDHDQFVKHRIHCDDPRENLYVSPACSVPKDKTCYSLLKSNVILKKIRLDVDAEWTTKFHVIRKDFC